MNDKDKIHKVIILGSGPSGLTAALYAARAQLKPVVFEGVEPGGQLTTTTEVENYPGFPEGIQGPELTELFRKQAQRFGSQTLSRAVAKVDLLERPFKIWTDDQQIHLTHTLIIATGSSYKWLGLESEQKLRGFGVSACATCDGFFFREKEIAVVGGGDTAMDEALFLARLGSKVTLIHRREQFRASKIMADRVMSHPKIEIKWNSSVVEVLGEPDQTGVTGVRIKNFITDETEVLPCSGFFVAIGHKPNSELFLDFLHSDVNGYIITEPASTATNIEGVFACGDVQDNTYRQVVTAAGSGAMAAMDAERWLEACELC
ncbi:MAG: thioredoxin-disulfide reductase [Planctomycetota bacterium]